MIQLKLRALLLATMLCALCVGQASALALIRNDINNKLANMEIRQ